jgi:hypothetical protein
MAEFGFGDLISDDFRGRTREVSQYALHIQCPWRIVQDGRLLVGRADWQWPPLGSDVSYGDFIEADAPRSRREDFFDEIGLHIGHEVVNVVGSETGDLRIVLTDGCALEVFPDSASTSPDELHDEHWRFFTPGSDDRHFVVTAHGIEA